MLSYFVWRGAWHQPMKLEWRLYNHIKINKIFEFKAGKKVEKLHTHTTHAGVCVNALSLNPKKIV